MSPWSIMKKLLLIIPILCYTSGLFCDTQIPVNATTTTTFHYPPYENGELGKAYVKRAKQVLQNIAQSNSLQYLTVLNQLLNDLKAKELPLVKILIAQQAPLTNVLTSLPLEEFLPIEGEQVSEGHKLTIHCLMAIAKTFESDPKLYTLLAQCVCAEADEDDAQEARENIQLLIKPLILAIENSPQQ
jgi:hypothetical protein